MHGLSFNKRCWCFALAIALGACTTTKAPIEYIDKPIVTEKPCLSSKDIPTRPSRLGPVPSSMEVALSTAMAKVSEWTRYGNKADVVMKACVK